MCFCIDPQRMLQNYSPFTHFLASDVSCFVLSLFLISSNRIIYLLLVSISHVCKQNRLKRSIVQNELNAGEHTFTQTHKREKRKKTMKQSKNVYLHTKKGRSMMRVPLFLFATIQFYHFFLIRSTLSFWLLS